MAGNIKHTAGANPQPKLFGIRKKDAKKFKLKQMFRQQHGQATKGNLKTWEDRNRANQNTKLNP